jgi:hypothetical protein
MAKALIALRIRQLLVYEIEESVHLSWWHWQACHDTVFLGLS